MNLIKKIFSPLLTLLEYIQNHFKAMLFLLLLAVIFFPSSDEELQHTNLQEIKLVGTIMDPSEVLEQIEHATNDNNIKGVLFSVNSPGGAVAPSVEIAYAIKRLAQKKPVVAYAEGTMASGSYYSSIWANKIIANPGSMIGSIGVIMQGANLQELMNKIGIQTQVVKAGKYKQLGTTDRKWKDFEVAELNKVIQGTYDMFTHDVAKARDLNISKRDQFANAHIFTASQAKNVGLVDYVGVKYDAKTLLKQLSGVDEAHWKEEDKFDKLLKKISASTAVIVQTYLPPLTLK